MSPSPLVSVRRSLTLGVALTLLATAGAARAEITATSGTAYAALCKSRGVPLPPSWGGSSMSWIRSPNPSVPSGSINGNFGDGFTGLRADVWYYQSTSATEPGLCLLAAHYDPYFFDVICQGTNGKACFWEGIQFPTPPAAPVVIASPAQATSFVKGGVELANAQGTDMCTRCHTGSNAFINHYDELFNGGNHPLQLRWMTGYLPTVPWFEPIVPTGWRENPPAETFPGYPASTKACQSCHKTGVGGYGGAFPALSADLKDKYCSVLSEATNRPTVKSSGNIVESRGGMPVGAGCTPGYPGTCAKDTDPFVKAILETGCTSPRSSTWGHWQKNRVAVNPDYSAPEKNNIPTGRTFVYSKDTTRLMPGVWSGVESTGSAWDRVTFAVGLGSRVSWWTKGSVAGRVTTFWSPDYARGEIWEYDGGSGGSPARHATEGASVFPIGQALGFRRHQGKSVIFYRGSDNGLHRLDWGTTWTYSALPKDLSGMGDSWAALTDPVAHRRTSGSDSVLFRQANCAKCIGEYRFAGNSTYFYTVSLPFAMKTGTQPIGFRDNAGYSMIFATTSDGGVYQIKDGSTTNGSYEYAAAERLFLDTKVASSPRPFIRADGKTGLVYTRELAGSPGVHKIGLLTNQSGSTWWGEDPTYNANNGTSDNEPEATLGDAVGFVNANGKDTIVYRGVSQAVYQLVYDPATSKWVRTKLYTPTF